MPPAAHHPCCMACQLVSGLSSAMSCGHAQAMLKGVMDMSHAIQTTNLLVGWDGGGAAATSLEDVREDEHGSNQTAEAAWETTTAQNNTARDEGKTTSPSLQTHLVDVMSTTLAPIICTALTTMAQQDHVLRDELLVLVGLVMGVLLNDVAATHLWITQLAKTLTSCQQSTTTTTIIELLHNLYQHSDITRNVLLGYDDDDDVAHGIVNAMKLGNHAAWSMACNILSVGCQTSPLCNHVLHNISMDCIRANLNKTNLFEPALFVLDKLLSTCNVNVYDEAFGAQLFPLLTLALQSHQQDGMATRVLSHILAHSEEAVRDALHAQVPIYLLFKISKRHRGADTSAAAAVLLMDEDDILAVDCMTHIVTHSSPLELDQYFSCCAEAINRFAVNLLSAIAHSTNAVINASCCLACSKLLNLSLMTTHVCVVPHPLLYCFLRLRFDSHLICILLDSVLNVYSALAKLNDGHDYVQVLGDFAIKVASCTQTDAFPPAELHRCMSVFANVAQSFPHLACTCIVESLEKAPRGVMSRLIRVYDKDWFMAVDHALECGGNEAQMLANLLQQRGIVYETLQCTTMTEMSREILFNKLFTTMGWWANDTAICQVQEFWRALQTVETLSLDLYYIDGQQISPKLDMHTCLALGLILDVDTDNDGVTIPIRSKAKEFLAMASPHNESITLWALGLCLILSGLSVRTLRWQGPSRVIMEHLLLVLLARPTHTKTRCLYSLSSRLDVYDAAHIMNLAVQVWGLDDAFNVAISTAIMGDEGTMLGFLCASDAMKPYECISRIIATSSQLPMKTMEHVAIIVMQELMERAIQPNSTCELFFEMLLKRHDNYAPELFRQTDLWTLRNRVTPHERIFIGALGQYVYPTESRMDWYRDAATEQVALETWAFNWLYWCVSTGEDTLTLPQLVWSTWMDAATHHQQHPEKKIQAMTGLSIMTKMSQTQENLTRVGEVAVTMVLNGPTDADVNIGMWCLFLLSSSSSLSPCSPWIQGFFRGDLPWLETKSMLAGQHHIHHRCHAAILVMLCGLDTLLLQNIQRVVKNDGMILQHSQWRTTHFSWVLAMAICVFKLQNVVVDNKEASLNKKNALNELQQIARDCRRTWWVTASSSSPPQLALAPNPHAVFIHETLVQRTTITTTTDTEKSLLTSCAELCLGQFAACEEAESWCEMIVNEILR